MRMKWSRAFLGCAGAFIFVLCGLLAPALVAFAATTFNGRVGNWTAGFLETERIRHNRWDVQLLQKSEIAPRFKTTMEGRFRFDAALYPDSRAPMHELSRAVRDDEMNEFEARQVYFDWMQDWVSVRGGLLQIDWIESLSTKSSDVMTPVDLRHGGFGTDTIVPQAALTANHKFWGGSSLEWLVVPSPEPHRLPKGPNGYGYEETIRSNLGRLVDPRLQVAIEHGDIPEGAKSVEGGLRLLKSFDSLDMTLMGYRGHQRSPSLILSQPSPGDLVLTSKFPPTSTFGLFGTWSGDEIVVRGIVVYEPKREPAFVNSVVPGQSDFFERRLRLGFGYDHVFSRHLKLYSEHWVNLATTELEEGSGGPPPKDKRVETGSASVRLINESFEDLFLSTDATFTGPSKSWVVSPQMAWTVSERWRASLGANLIRSLSDTSTFHWLRDASHVWVAIDAWFDGNDVGS